MVFYFKCFNFIPRLETKEKASAIVLVCSVSFMFVSEESTLCLFNLIVPVLSDKRNIKAKVLGKEIGHRFLWGGILCEEVIVEESTAS